MYKKWPGNECTERYACLRKQTHSIELSIEPDSVWGVVFRK